MITIHGALLATLRIGGRYSIALACALIASDAIAVPNQDLETTAGAHYLGKARSTFGDKWARSDPHWQNNREWIYHDMLSDYSTEIYFPAGVSNERYYVQRVNVRDPHTQKMIEEYVLLLETKRREGTIHLEWKVYLDVSAAAPVVIPGLLDRVGTLTALLSRRGLEVREPVGKEARKRLDEVRGLAGYWRVHPNNDSLLYWYVNRDGTTTSPKWSSGDPDSFAGFPVTKIPYPVTQAEMADLRRHPVRS